MGLISNSAWRQEASAMPLLSIILLAGTLTSCSSPVARETHDRPLATSGRHWLKVRPQKLSLGRKDIEAIALTYRVFEKNEKPSVGSILLANKECRPSPQKEELVLEQGGAAAGEGPPCKIGFVLVPVLEPTTQDEK